MEKNEGQRQTGQIGNVQPSRPCCLTTAKSNAQFAVTLHLLQENQALRETLLDIKHYAKVMCKAEPNVALDAVRAVCETALGDQ